MKLLQLISYLVRVQKRFGFRAVVFLIQSKFRSRPAADIKIRRIQHPITLSNFNVDVTTLFQIMFAEEYKIDFEKAPETIVDCGANIGLSTVYFANKYPNATIIAVEPDARNYSFLEKNTAPYAQIHCLQRAVWSSNERLSVVDPGRGSWSFQTKVSKNGDVLGITLDEIMTIYSLSYIDLLKIDIEGGEEELFTRKYVNWIAKTRTIAIELHDFIKPGSSKPFFKAITQKDFVTYPRGENLICIRRDRI